MPKVPFCSTLLTPRLALIPTPLPVLQRRLKPGAFAADVVIDNVQVSVMFPTEWPGDALGLFPMMIAAMATDPANVPWGGTVVARQGHVAVGQIGCKGFPDASGIIEIGYGINPAYWNQGYASEIVSAFAAWLLHTKVVTCVTAECRIGNQGSIRVLEKSGFTRTGMRDDAVIVWERRV